MPRLFVAVYPPQDVVEALAALSHQEVDRGEALSEKADAVRWVPAEQYHLTLRFFGNAEVEPVMAALDPAVAGLESTEVVLGPRVRRLGRNVICVPSAGLEHLAHVVGEATAQLGEPVDPRPFRGHITLARLRSPRRHGLVGSRFSATFQASEIRLVESITRPPGAEHSTLRSWPLSA